MTCTVDTVENINNALFGLPPVVHNWVPYQYQFGGLSFGAKTPYVVESVEGLLGYQASSSDFSSDTSTGAVPGFLSVNPKTINITIKVDAHKGEDAEGKITDLKKAFRVPQRSLNVWVGDYASRGYFTDRASYLTYYRPGWSDARTIYCRVTKFDIVSNFDTGSGFIICNISLQAPDPFSYGYNTYVLTIPSGESYVWTQDGDVIDGYPPYVTMTGAMTNPEIKSVRSDFLNPGGLSQSVKMNFSWTGTVSLDMRNRLIDPIGANTNLLISQFWSVRPGEQTISYSGGGESSVYIRECWQ